MERAIGSVDVGFRGELGTGEINVDNDIYVITMPTEWVRLSRRRMSNERRRWFRME